VNDDPRLIVSELVAVFTADVDVRLIGASSRVEVGVGNTQRRTADSCVTEINFVYIGLNIMMSAQSRARFFQLPDMMFGGR
jgi:hypothetical protein